VTTPYTEPWENKTRALTAGASHQPIPAPPLVRNPVDRELNAMNTIDTILSRLDHVTRSRVLTWAASRADALRFGLASATSVDGDTPWPSHTVEDMRPNVVNGDDTDPDYEWPNVSVYLGSYEPIHIRNGESYTVDGARTVAAELLSAAHRVDTHTETT
jgi:hypothetical protein